MGIADTICRQLQALATREKRETLPRFFKTGKGEYGEGDKFIGVVVPHIRSVARQHTDLEFDDIATLLCSEWHEMRECGLFILVLQADRLDKPSVRKRMPPAEVEEKRKAIVDFYLAHTNYINNWDLVDLSAPAIIGRYLLHHDRSLLYHLADSRSLWENRIAVVSTLTLIRTDEYEDTYRLALHMIHHPHDLMHKAIGWMLREAGKHDAIRLRLFVEDHRHEMPRTMLRYAIERMDKDTRAELMKR